MSPAAPQPAATLLLVRDGPSGVEVLMVQRHAGLAFASGAMVFPGGKIAPSDGDLRVCALRETFEECGLLLARARGEPAFLGKARAAALGRLWRARVAAEAAAFAELLHEEGLEPACDALIPFARWVTPETSPRRFDAHFFISAAPGDQAPLHDGGESVAAIWLRPSDALREAAARRRKVMFPTLVNLNLLAQAGSVEAALAAARARRIIALTPRMERRGDGKVVPQLPEGSGYPPLPAELLELSAR